MKNLLFISAAILFLAGCTAPTDTKEVDELAKKNIEVVMNLLEAFENEDMENILVEKYNKARTNFNTLKAIAVICNHAEMEYNSQKAKEELLAGESAKTDKTVKKKKKKKKKKKAPITVVTQEEKAKVEPKDTPTEELAVVGSIPEEEDTEEEKEEDTETKKKH